MREKSRLVLRHSRFSTEVFNTFLTDQANFFIRASPVLAGYSAIPMKSITEAPNHSAMTREKSARREMLWLIVLAAVAMASIFLFSRPGGAGDATLPDEKLAGEALLAQKFTGPGYFQLEASPRGAGTETESEELYLTTPYKAGQQVERIVKERHLSPEKEANLRALIDQLTIPPQSRVYGGERVHVLRLNLALDALR